MSMTQTQVENLTNIDDLIATFTGDNGFEVYVTEGRFGYHVSIKDTDCNEFVPHVECFRSEEAAIDYARSCIA